jgi:uncharacterized membrane protein YqjE
VASVRRLAAAFAAALHTRVELLALELEEAKVRFTRLLLFGVAALFFLGLGGLTVTFFVIAAFWEGPRLVAIGVLVLVYFGLAAGALLWARREAARGSRLFSRSIAQLRKDRERFTSS